MGLVADSKFSFHSVPDPGRQLIPRELELLLRLKLYLRNIRAFNAH